MKRLLIAFGIVLAALPGHALAARQGVLCHLPYRGYQTFTVGVDGVPGLVVHAHHKNKGGGVRYWAIGRHEGPRVIIEPVYAPNAWEAKCGRPVLNGAHQVGKKGLRKSDFAICRISTRGHLQIAEVWVTKADVMGYTKLKPLGVRVDLGNGGSADIIQVSSGTAFTKITCPGAVSKGDGNIGRH